MSEPTPTRASIIEIVRNKNNKEEVRLKRRLNEYGKMLASKIVRIDHQRLDAYDFLRKLRFCESDYMKEFEAIRFEIEEIKKAEEEHRLEMEKNASLNQLPVIQSNNNNNNEMKNKNKLNLGESAFANISPFKISKNYDETPRHNYKQKEDLRLPSVDNLSAIQRKMLPIQRSAMLNNKDDKQRNAILILQAKELQNNNCSLSAVATITTVHNRFSRRMTAGQSTTHCKAHPLEIMDRRLNAFYKKVDELSPNQVRPNTASQNSIVNEQKY